MTIEITTRGPGLYLRLFALSAWLGGIPREVGLWLVERHPGGVRVWVGQFELVFDWVRPEPFRRFTRHGETADWYHDDSQGDPQPKPGVPSGDGERAS